MHIALAEIAQKPLCTAVLQTVHENILGRWLQVSPTDEKIIKENHKDLYDIVNAVEAGSRTRPACWHMIMSEDSTAREGRS
jgi:DNA-binding FadR family transcriptional regulator